MTTDQTENYRFPRRDGNHYRLYVDGEQFFPAMFDAIARAKHRILFEQYLVESGAIATRLIDELIAARRSGVEVYMLLDDYGCKGLGKQDREIIEKSGIRLVWYNPTNIGSLNKRMHRDHRKLLVVDDRIVFTGGAGFIDEFDHASHPKSWWHETMISIRGPCVSDWIQLFIETWQSQSSIEIRNHVAVPPIKDGHRGRVVNSESPTHSGLTRSFMHRIRKARSRVWLMTPYFLPSWKMRRALRKKALEGVDVRLVLPGPRNDHIWTRFSGQRFFDRHLRDGVRIYEYQPRFLHAKILLSDQWISTGSSNIDRWNLRWNLDSNQELEDPDMTAAIEQLFLNDMENSKEIRLEDWRRRPWWHRLLEWTSSLFVRYLSWFSYNRKQQR